jgi:hypothetical protein
MMEKQPASTIAHASSTSSFARSAVFLRLEPAKLRHAHRCNADVALNGDAGFDDRLDVFGMMLVAFALHHFSAALGHVLRGIVHRLLRGQVKAHVGHVDHAQPVLRTALDRLCHEHDLLERHRGSRFVAEENHSARIRHTEDVNAYAVRDDGSLIVVYGELHDGLALLHFFEQHRDRYFPAFLCGLFCHGPS